MKKSILLLLLIIILVVVAVPASARATRTEVVGEFADQNYEPLGQPKIDGGGNTHVVVRASGPFHMEGGNIDIDGWIEHDATYIVDETGSGYSGGPFRIYADEGGQELIFEGQKRGTVDCGQSSGHASARGQSSYAGSRLTFEFAEGNVPAPPEIVGCEVIGNETSNFSGMLVEPS